MRTSDIPKEPALATVRARLQQGVRATPLCRAIMGWLCETPTTPSVVDVGLFQGDVWLRLSDEAEPEPVGTLLNFLAQVHLIAVSLGMNEEEAQQIVAAARRRLA
jgi:hypothetical protein